MLMARWQFIGLVAAGVVAGAIILFVAGRQAQLSRDGAGHSERTSLVPADVGPEAAPTVGKGPANPDSDERASSPSDDIRTGDGDTVPRTSAGLRETKVEMRLPIVDASAVQVPETPAAVTWSGSASGSSYAASTHPLAPGEHVVETNDGPRGPNSIQNNAAVPLPLAMQPLDLGSPGAELPDAGRPVDDQGGPSTTVPPDLASLPPPQLSPPDPQSPDADTTVPRSSN